MLLYLYSLIINIIETKRFTVLVPEILKREIHNCEFD